MEAVWRPGKEQSRGINKPSTTQGCSQCCPLCRIPTCADVCLAEQPGEAAHGVEGVEVVHVLVQPVHPILVLQTGGGHAVGRCPAG